MRIQGIVRKHSNFVSNMDVLMDYNFVCGEAQTTERQVLLLLMMMMMMLLLLVEFLLERLLIYFFHSK